jgi:predicted transcriptional regulator
MRCGMAKSKPSSTRLEPEVKAALNRAAKEQDRSVSWLINKILAAWAAGQPLPEGDARVDQE